MAMLEYRDRHPGHGVFLIERCSDGVVVGNMVIRHAELKEDGAIEVGYVIDPAHWGNGYATEGLQILQEYAHQQLGYSKLTAFTDAENVASGKVLKKCGFEIKGTTYIYGADLLHWERIGF